MKILMNHPQPAKSNPPSDHEQSMGVRINEPMFRDPERIARAVLRPFSFLQRMIVALGCLGLVSGSSALAEPPVWVNVTNDLGGDAVNWAMSTLTLGVAPGTDTVYAHIGRVGLFASKDGGAHWTNLVTPPETSPINGYVNSFLFDPKDPKTFWITCWYLSLIHI